MDEPTRDPEMTRRFLLALELSEAAFEIKRQNLRRENPGASEEEIDTLFAAWLRHRPGAEHGDGPQPEDQERMRRRRAEQGERGSKA